MRAFYRNKPYVRFIREHLAGDEMVVWRDAPKYNDEILEDLIATGYLRCCEDISQEDPRLPDVNYISPATTVTPPHPEGR